MRYSARYIGAISGCGSTSCAHAIDQQCIRHLVEAITSILRELDNLIEHTHGPDGK